MILAYFPDATRSALSSVREPIEVERETRASVLQSSWADIQHVEELYIFRNLREVRSFLELYPFLVPMLVSAYVKIGGYFPNSQIVLDLYTDPELPNGSQVVAYILTELAPEDALQKLSQLGREWALDAMRRAKGKFRINLEFL